MSYGVVIHKKQQDLVVRELFKGSVTSTEIKVGQCPGWVEVGDCIPYLTQEDGSGKFHDRSGGSISVTGYSREEYRESMGSGESKDHGVLFAIIGYGALYTELTQRLSKRRALSKGDFTVNGFQCRQGSHTDPDFLRKGLADLIVDYSIVSGDKHEDNHFIDLVNIDSEPSFPDAEYQSTRMEFLHKVWNALKGDLLQDIEDPRNERYIAGHDKKRLIEESIDISYKSIDYLLEKFSKKDTTQLMIVSPNQERATSIIAETPFIDARYEHPSRNTRPDPDYNFPWVAARLSVGKIGGINIRDGSIDPSPTSPEYHLSVHDSFYSILPRIKKRNTRLHLIVGKENCLKQIRAWGNEQISSISELF